MMRRTLLALSAIAAMTVVSASLASAQDIHVGPGGMGVGPDHGYRDRDYGYRDRGENCHLVISHRMGPNGSVTVRRRVCD
jgi:hypothetical protein